MNGNTFAMENCLFTDHKVFNQLKFHDRLPDTYKFPE